MRLGAVIQARLSSTRLPGKILLPLPHGGDAGSLAHVIRRAAAAGRFDEIIVATTDGHEDDAVVEVARREGARVFRGSRDDVLGRFDGAAREAGLDLVVRLTSDCPCLDPGVVRRTIEAFERGRADFASNVLEKSWPYSMACEVFPRELLERAAREASAPFEREHVTPYLKDRARFRVLSVVAPPEEHDPTIRVTLDTPDDYTLLLAVFDALYPADPCFGVSALLALFGAKPWLRRINAESKQKKPGLSLAEEVTEAVKILRRQDLPRAAALLERHAP